MTRVLRSGSLEPLPCTHDRSACRHHCVSLQRHRRQHKKVGKATRRNARGAGDTWLSTIVGWSVGLNAAVLGWYEIARQHPSECLKVGLDLGNKWGASYPLDAFAALAVAEKRYDFAARLFGASDAQRIQSGLVPRAADHPAIRAILTAATAFSGPDVEDARRDGQGLSLEAATSLALGNG